MSLEKMLEANTAAVEANTEVLKQVLANQNKALAGIASKDEPAEDAPRRSRRAAEEPAADETPRRSRRAAADEETTEEAPRRSRRAAAEEPAAEEDPPRRSSRRAAAEETEEAPRRSSRRAAADEDEAPRAKPKKDEKPKKPTLDDIKAAFADLLATDDKDEEDDRRDFIESILDELAVAKTNQIKEADFADVLEWVALKKAGKKVTF